MNKKKPLTSVRIYLPDRSEDHMVGVDDVTEITEIHDGSPCIMMEQGKSQITYCGFPYIYKEKTVE
jgi:hypothetical protein